MMKHLLKVLLLVNFEFQGILTNSLGGGGFRGLPVGTWYPVQKRPRHAPASIPGSLVFPCPWGHGWKKRSSGNEVGYAPVHSQDLNINFSTLSAFISYNFSDENLVLGQRIYPCGYPFHCISGRKSINIKRNSFLVTCVSERIRWQTTSISFFCSTWFTCCSEPYSTSLPSVLFWIRRWTKLSVDKSKYWSYE